MAGVVATVINRNKRKLQELSSLEEDAYSRESVLVRAAYAYQLMRG